MFKIRTRIGPPILLALLSAAAVGQAVDPLADPSLGLDPTAQPAEPKPTITVSPESPKTGDTLTVAADFKLDKGVKLYHNSLRFEWARLEGVEVIADKDFPKPEGIIDDSTDPPSKTKAYKGRVTIPATLKVTAQAGERIVIEGKIHHLSCAKLCFPPAFQAITYTYTIGKAGSGQLTVADERQSAAPKAPAQDGSAGDANVLWRIVFAFLGGVLLSLTPCVYPMIPVTAAVVGARKERGLASAFTASVVYVLGLSIVYALLGLVIARAGVAARSVLSSAYVLVPVSLIFVALAVVMFAGLNFAAPTGFAAKLQSKLAGRKGLLATFGLGAASGLIVGPCVTAPLAGVLIYIAKKADPLLGFWMLFAVAWGMGIPLVLFGTATGLMPKAGAWMEWIKRLLGFVLLWAAVYFVQPIIGDVAYQLLFAAVLVAAAVFLGGFDSLTRESKLGDRLKKVFGIVLVMYAVALFLAPFIQPAPIGASVFKPGTPEQVEKVLASGKPVVLDFHASWCTICKALDRSVYSRPEAVAAAKGLAAFKIDVDQHRAMADQYEVLGVPALLFVDSAGNIAHRVDGELTLGQFIELVKEHKGR